MMNSVEYDRVIEEPGSHPQAKSMPIDASTQVHFIQRLQREGRLSLDAVYDIFFKTPKSRNPQTLRTLLLGHYGDGETGELIVVARTNSQSVSLLDEAVLANPKDYDVVYNGCAWTETNYYAHLGSRLVPEQTNEIGTYAHVVAHDPVVIHGDAEAALPQIRRLEAFTNYVGNLVVQRRFDDLANRFWDRTDAAHSPQALADALARLERKYGRIELFGEPKVYAIYAGTGRGLKHFDEMKTPKGVTREQRVGVSCLALASSITANGVPRWVINGHLETVEVEQGEFRLTLLEWRYTR